MKRTVFLLQFTALLSSVLVLILPVGAEIIPAERRIDWTQAGVPGGIPHRTVIFRTISASAYGNGITDATSVIQSALNDCPAGQVIYLPAGIYKIMNTLNIGSNTTLRGDGPGNTILRFGGGGRSAVSLNGEVYFQISTIRSIFSVMEGMTKGSTVLTLSSVNNMNVGDLMLMDQLNDGTLVDANGVEGFCNYCGREEGKRTLGQILKISAINVSSNTITIHQPLNYTYSESLSPQVVVIPAKSYIDKAGVEDLTVTQPLPLYTYLVEMQGTQNSWLRNVEIANIDWRAVWLTYGLQNEIRECFVHTSVNGYGRSHGYGVYLDNFSTANLVEDNVFKTIDGGGIMAGSGVSGNVVAYNIISDHRFDDFWWVNGSPSLNHNPHPMMNLWEGNKGYKLEGDFIHGSSSHNTIFRSRSMGWQSDSATTGNAAVALARKNTYFNVVGCVLGTAQKSNNYEVVATQIWNTTENSIWLLGVTCNSIGMEVLPTLLRHGNFDYFTYSVKWDSTISDHVLPASLYLQESPFFFGSVPWPPIGPDVPNYYNKIPSEKWLDQFYCSADNTPPVALNQDVSTIINTAVLILPAATDAQNDQLRFFIANGKEGVPIHGDLFWDDTGLIYQPAEGYTGDDSFSFFANDARSSSNYGTIKIHIQNTLETTSDQNVKSEVNNSIADSNNN